MPSIQQTLLPLGYSQRTGSPGRGLPRSSIQQIVDENTSRLRMHRPHTIGHGNGTRIRIFPPPLWPISQRPFTTAGCDRFFTRHQEDTPMEPCGFCRWPDSVVYKCAPSETPINCLTWSMSSSSGAASASQSWNLEPQGLCMAWDRKGVEVSTNRDHGGIDRVQTSHNLCASKGGKRSRWKQKAKIQPQDTLPFLRPSNEPFPP